MAKRTDIQDLVEQFVDRLSSLIEQDTVSRARDAVLTAFGGHSAAGSSRGASGARGRFSSVRCPAAPTAPPRSSEWSARSTRTCRRRRSRSTESSGAPRRPRPRVRTRKPPDGSRSPIAGHRPKRPSQARFFTARCGVRATSHRARGRGLEKSAAHHAPDHATRNLSLRRTDRTHACT